MKKLIVILVILINLVVVNAVRAVSFSYKWENVYIDVSMYQSLNAYDDMPKATLYRDGQILNDAKISYNRNGDWLYYYKDVDTSVPGEYKVWYKVSESVYKPGHCPNYKQLITFNVVDDIMPTITMLSNEINIPINTKKYDYTPYFNARDNYELKVVNIDDSLVDYKAVGSYEVKIEAIDSSDNTTSKIITVNVIDDNGPVVTFLGDNNTIIIEKGEEVDFSTYFKAQDEIDGDVLSSLAYDKTKLDINMVGTYEVIFSFRDSSGNAVYETINIEVVDENLPTLNLTVDNITLDYKTEPSYDLFKNYILEAIDGVDDLYDKVEIDYSDIKQAVGTYYVTYSVKDENNNSISKDLMVNYITSKAPEISCQDVVVALGEEVNLANYVTITDESDSTAANTLEIDTSKYNNKMAGIYYLNVTCHNSSNLYANSILKVTVKDNSSSFNLNFILLPLLAIVIIAGGVYLLIKKKRSKTTI